MRQADGAAGASLGRPASRDGARFGAGNSRRILCPEADLVLFASAGSRRRRRSCRGGGVRKNDPVISRAGPK